MIWIVVAFALSGSDPIPAQVPGTLISPGQVRHDQAVADAKAGRLRYYPLKAEAAGGISGEASINCEIDRDGWPDDCRLVEEKPSGYDFGATALKMAPIFRLKRKPDDPPFDPNHPFRLTFPLHFRPAS